METPSFTSLAQIYNLDKIQKTWTPLTDSVLPVQFFASDDYQVKAVDPAKGVIFETTVQQNTVFKKSGEAFVQWYDSANKQMYGLNLKSKADSIKIEEFFQEGLKKLKGSSSETVKAKNSRLESDDSAPKNLMSGNSTFADPPKNEASEKLLSYVANLESKMKDINVEDQHYVGVLETRIKHLEEKIELLEQTNNDLKLQVTKTQDSGSKQIALMTKDNDLLKAALQQSNQQVESQKRQVHTLQEINGKLSEKLTSISKVYDTFGQIISKP